MILYGTNFRESRYFRSLWTKILCVIFLHIMNIPPNLYAHPSTDSGHRIRFNHITNKQGLSHNSVYAILQDSKGFMWFGTYVGLSKYDGYQFTVYKHDPENPTSLSHNAVVSLYEDRFGVLWIGTAGGGLNRFDRDAEQFVRYQHDPDDPQSLGHNRIGSIYEDRAGLLWIGTAGGLDQFDRDTGRCIHYRHDPDNPGSLSQGAVFTICEDQLGVLWIGAAGGGLNRFDRATGQFVHYCHDPRDPQSLSHNEVSVIYENRWGELWIGTTGGGLNRFDQATEQFVHYHHDPRDPQSVSSDNIISLFEDHRGRLWIGTDDKGLNRFDRATGRFIRYRHDPGDVQSLNDDNIRSMYMDRSGVLWIGTKNGGLNTFDRGTEQFLHYQHDPNDPQSLNHNVVYAIHEDRSKVLWIGTRGGGLNRFDRKTGQFRYYQNDPNNPWSLSNTNIRAIYEDHLGILWIGTDDGLNRFDREMGQIDSYRHVSADPQSLSNNIILSIYEDRSGVLWIGTDDGLNRFDRATEQFICYQHDPENFHSLGSSDITTLYEDRSGELWIGTYSGGLNRFDRNTGQCIRYQHNPANPQSLSHNIILSIYEDRSGVFWIGTRGGGLNKFDRESETFTRYREKDGLPNDTVYGILEDGQGNLWLSTNQGLSKFNPQTEIFKNYDESDGLQGNEFNTGAYCKGKDGMMFFGGFNGFNAFYPDDITDNPYIPPVVITDFQLFHRPVPIGENSPLQKPIGETDALTLSYKDFIFSFTFAALNYVSPEKNRYAYKLEGFDKDWNNTDSKHRLAIYTNLDSGEYIFKVKASNNDGVWNNEGTSLTITITSPWWETWWFRVLILVCLVGMAFTTHRIRVKTLESHKRQLERQVAERTQDLQQEIAERKRTEEVLRESEERYRAVFEQAADSIVLSDPETGDLVEFNDRAYGSLNYTREEFQKLKIADIEAMETSREITKHIRKVIKEKGDIFETRHRTKDGEIRDILVSTRAITLQGKNFILGIWRDITGRKRAEEQIKSALAEKEVLLQEIHHRVKNNLQVVSNLLDFQSEYVQDARTLDMFRDCQNRVGSMALVHEQLYRSESLAKIDFAGYIQNLTATLFDSFGAMSAAVTAKIDIEEVVLDIDTALTCGLIVNELVSNALKYAFPIGKAGEIGIALHSRANQHLTLIISDNGTGFPEDVDFHNTPSLGLQLVRIFTEQLDGTVELEKNKGTTFTITFPEPE